jgi:uncharacterized RmlC-like cupin family protein/quercetin dioxygenase-like cupin family protein
MILPVLLLLAFQPPMLENDSVMVHLATDQPHSHGAMHHHNMDRVMIYLDNGEQRIEHEGGKIDQLVWKKGQVAWSPAGGNHISQNATGQVLRIIEIELKPLAPAAKPFVISPLDPVKVDPARFHMEFENDRVRVFRGKYGPHEEGAMHEHLHNRVVAYLTTGELGVTTDGKKEVKKLTANTVSWGEPTKHRESVGDSAIEMIVVELKNR